MLIGMFMFSAADMHSKYLTTDFHPIQISWFRQLGLFVGVLFILGFHGKSILQTQQPVLQIGRGALAVCSSGLLFVFAVKYVPLADAVAASFVAPFFLTIMGATLLGEKVGIRRWSAVLVGFLGALVIVRPGMGVIHPAVMLVVLAAACYAARQVIGRLLADTDKTITTIAYTSLTATFIISLPLPFVWHWPEIGFHWLVLISMAVLSGIGEVMVVRSLVVAEAAVVAPVHYSLIVWGTIYGFFIFDQLPDLWTCVGTAIIVAAGFYTFQRDRVNRK